MAVKPQGRRATPRSPEQRVLDFFETANLASANLLLNLARGKLRARLGHRKGAQKANPKRRTAAPRQGKPQV